MSVTRHYILAAGGTGGHMLPAFALGRELLARGHRVALVTDQRGTAIPGVPDGMAVHMLPAGRLDGGLLRGGVLGAARAGRAIWRGRAAAAALMREFQPAAVAGFGGYPSLPSLLAAGKLGVPRLIHEQNAVLGRVNRLMARRVDAIAVAYRQLHRLPAGQEAKLHLTGNPVRDAILAIRADDFPPLGPDGIFRMLVVGGSLGATVLSDVVPLAVQLLPPALRARMQVVQQCRAEDLDRVRASYLAVGVPATCEPYFADMADRMRWAHLFIGRAGASTVAELGVAGRPAIFVPYPSATDDHQRHNVTDMVRAGGATMILQPHFTPGELAKQLQKIALEPGALETAAARAAECGRPMATQDLADLLEQVGGAPLMDVIRVGQGTRAAPRRSPQTSSRQRNDGDGA